MPLVLQASLLAYFGGVCVIVLSELPPVIVSKGVNVSVLVFEQLQVLRKRVGYWKLHERAGRLVLRVDPHIVLRVLVVFHIIYVPRCYGEIVAAGIEWYARSDHSIAEARVWDIDLKYRTIKDYGGAYTLRH